jgi:phage tail sheath protein FI
MPSYLHPGVYVEEIPSGSKPIEGVSTSNALFAGYTTKGAIGEASLISKWDDYVDAYGGIHSENDAMGLSINLFYLNGGQAAYVARLAASTVSSSLTPGLMKGRATGPADAINVLSVSASSAGMWGDAVYVRATNTGDGYRFTLEVGSFLDGSFVASEVFKDLSMDPTDSAYVPTVVNGQSKLIRVDLAGPLKSSPTTYFRRGVSVSDDLSGITWTDVHEGMKLTLNIDNLGARIITLGAAPGGTYDSAVEVCDELQARIRALGPDNSYHNATVAFAANAITITSGTQTASSSVIVRPGELAGLLKLGTGAGGTETHGTFDVIPATMGAAVALTGGNDGDLPGLADYQAFFTKMKKVRDVSIIVLPGQFLPKDGSGNTVVDAAIAHAEETKNRMVVIDPEPGFELDQAGKASNMLTTTSSYTSLYYPWARIRNPLYNVDTNPTAPLTVFVAPSAIAAGVWARIDSTRGVWKAPAGVETSLRGLVGLQFTVDDTDQDQLNPLGVNCLRRFPGYGSVVWGTRTLSTKANPEWRYVPVRRTAIFIEESIYNGIQWAVFEPNDHRLWASLRANIGGFMNGLFRAGAFQGETANDAYFVRCGLGDTMTRDDIDRGQVIVIVGFAPLKPAEFVIVRIQQKVAQQ